MLARAIFVYTVVAVKEGCRLLFAGSRPGLQKPQHFALRKPRDFALRICLVLVGLPLGGRVLTRQLHLLKFFKSFKSFNLGLGLGLILLAAMIFGGCANSNYNMWLHAPPANSDKSQQPHAKSVVPGVRSANPDDVAAFDAAVELATQLRYAEAQRKFQPLLERFVAAENIYYASETLFWLGYCSEKQSRLDAAEQFYNRVIAEYPRTPAADQAQRRLEELPRGDEMIRGKK